MIFESGRLYIGIDTPLRLVFGPISGVDFSASTFALSVSFTPRNGSPPVTLTVWNFTTESRLDCCADPQTFLLASAILSGSEFQAGGPGIWDFTGRLTVDGTQGYDLTPSPVEIEP